jgi:nitroreductase
MTFIELARRRYSCRNYDPGSVEKDKLGLVLEAGRIAPSAANHQPWHFIVIREMENLKKVHGAYHGEWFQAAPCVIVICGDHTQSWKRKRDGKDHCDIDIAIAVDHMTLQATELGLATCWICNFDKEKTTKILDLPSSLEPIVILPLGYPLDRPDPSRHGEKRKSIQDIVSFESL